MSGDWYADVLPGKTLRFNCGRAQLLLSLGGRVLPWCARLASYQMAAGVAKCAVSISWFPKPVEIEGLVGLISYRGGRGGPRVREPLP